MSAPTSVIEISTPKDSGLLLLSASIVEELGRTHSHDLYLLSEDPELDPDALLGCHVTVKMELPDNAFRHFDSIAVRVEHCGVQGRYYKYRVTGRPWTWVMTRTSDCRIFQSMTVPEIIKQIFSKYAVAKFDFKIDMSKYRTWEYCVQYRESDFNFVSRLMETEGIYYYFSHKDGEHMLVLCDESTVHDAYPGCQEIAFIPHDQAARLEEEYFTEWTYTKSVHSGLFSHFDYDFQKPLTTLTASSSNPRTHVESSHEIFDYPGYFKEFGDGDHYAKVRMEELACQYARSGGTGNVRRLAVGRTFTLQKPATANQEKPQYLVVSAHHTLTDNGHEANGSGGADYKVSCTVIDIRKDHFRPARTTPKPHVQGPQPAVVVGKAGEEIYTDEFGRVKVQFFWDRYGKRDENSTCWIRVSHPWSGKNWGMVAIPRIGQEVIVDFYEGDPDQPIVTGRVYNASQAVPYALPANKTQTGILSRSTQDGTTANANEIRFEDKKGSEYLLIHAEKDQMIEVENDETHWVGRDRKKTIDRDETTLVQRNRTETVGKDETITIHGNRTETVDLIETITVHKDRQETVDGDETLNIHKNRKRRTDLDETLSVGQNRHTDIGMDDKLSVSGSQTIHVSRIKTETVQQMSNEFVLGLKTSTILGAYLETVGLARHSIVGMSDSQYVAKNKTIRVDGDFTIKVGKTFSVECGGCIIKLTAESNTVAITGKHVNITAEGEDVTINGKKVWINPEGGKAAAHAEGAPAQRQDWSTQSNAFAGNGTAPGQASPFSALSHLASGAKQVAGVFSAVGVGGKGMGIASQVLGGLAGGASSLTTRDGADTPAGMGDLAPSSGNDGLLGGLDGPGSLAGLGSAVKGLAALSPTLTGLLNNFQKTQGGSVLPGQPGKGTYSGVTATGNPAVFVDPEHASNPGAVASSLAHEIGGQYEVPTLDMSSADAFANAALARQGAGVLNATQVQREILANGGPNINPNANLLHDQIYTQMDNGVVPPAAAREQIGQTIGATRCTANPDLTHADFHSASYAGAFKG